MWVNRDGKLIILARGVRAFAQGFIAVLLAIYLDKLGFSLIQIGAFLSAGVAGSAFFAFLLSMFAEKVGRRRLLVIFPLMSAVSGLALVFLEDFVLLTAVTFIGNLVGAGEPRGGGPVQPIEQASLSDTAPPARRTDVFAIYGIIATAGSALGALASGLPALYQDAFDLSDLAAYKPMFAGFAFCLALSAILSSLLSPSIEVAAKERRWVNPLRLPSRRRIFMLTSLFSIDHFGGALVIQSLVSYWFSTRFDVQLESLALIFFASYVLEAISLWLAAKLANRIGLINTMVFTHIPSSLFLIVATFAPTAWMAVLFWQLRAFLGEMDVPTRESYTMAVVGSDERVAMASIHSVGRNLSGALGPSVATALWHALSASAPLVVAAVLKITYDISLYIMFRNVKPPEEAQKELASSEHAAE